MSCPDCDGIGGHDCEAFYTRPLPPVTSPYRFTVSVEHDSDWHWTVWLEDESHPDTRSARDAMCVRAHILTEAEAHEDAALVLAALHQATMEET